MREVGLATARVEGRASGIARIIRKNNAEKGAALMTVEEKLQVMEAIWDDLTRNDENFESPNWHEAALKERREQEARGETPYTDGERAKEDLRRRSNDH